jgi:hypothetical protein
MIDIFALALTHALMLYIAVQLHLRKDLDRDTKESTDDSEKQESSHHA